MIILILLKLFLLIKKKCALFTGVYEGRLGRIDTTRHASAGHVPVLIDIGSRVTKQAIVSVWSIARPCPGKAHNFAKAAVMQKPSFEKALKALTKKYVLVVGFKSESGMSSLLDLLFAECEIAKENLKNEKEIQYND